MGSFQSVPSQPCQAKEHFEPPPPYSIDSESSFEKEQLYPSSDELTKDHFDHFKNDFSSNPKNLLAVNAVTRNDISAVTISREAVIKNIPVFSTKLELEGKATNQKSSGRCWLFASTNVLRLILIKKYNLEDDFELSQSYLYFYDKLEKSNYFLESVLDLIEVDVNDRNLAALLSDPASDGGQWDMLVNLINKYGVVPKSVYPESFQSSNSKRLSYLVVVKLREFAARLRKEYRNGKSLEQLRRLKMSMISDIYRILAISLGTPPTEFDWCIYNKSKKLIEHRSLTPKKFFENIIGYPLQDTLSLINDPRNEYNKLYTVKYLGNIVGGHPIRYVNIPIEEMKAIACRVLQSGRPVWFGCDVGQFSHNEFATMDTALYDYESTFSVKLGLTKAERILYGESRMTHAMMFTGVHIENGRPVRWRVENSWGDNGPEKGFWIMSDAWFSEFVYQIVVEKRDAGKYADVLKQDPIAFPPYDPFGSLA
ncbi:uncharacterized protein VTP21DRAFT_4763 [Calcarisporiella thermophila]|uniref:uncharacterized protein n=1 Tax=Calcarisporiella thermophila TaxID=911321 RepID=UPI0037421488